MNINFSNFTPIESLLGGALIGLASLLLFVLFGRIAGISGITGGLFSEKLFSEKSWRAVFILGMIIAPAIAVLMLGYSYKTEQTAVSPVYLVIAGILVGYGSRLGSGCTSGHGICGVSRLSIRSVVSVLVFMTAGIATVFITQHLI